MANCYLLSLGGTGSKCMEAFVHMAAAGLAPAQVHVGVIDQDGANGNLIRTQKALASYMELHSVLRSSGGDHLLAADDRIPFLGTSLVPLSDPVTWSPIADDAAATSLMTLFGKGATMPPVQEHLLDILYPLEDQAMTFSIGYRGKPSVGAAAFLSQTDPRVHSIWQNIHAGVARANAGAISRFFLFGSVFGGTGAASFPTVARLIRQIARDAGQGRVEISGVLMLPYFLFQTPPPEKANEVAHSELFLQQTQGALRYYASLMQREQGEGGRLFDTLYLAGWNPMIMIDGFSEGGPTQANPPLVPELVAAQAACDFFQHGPGDGESLRLMARDTTKPFSWEGIPPVRRADGRDLDVGRRIGQLLRFCHQFNRIYWPALSDEDPQNWRAYNWYERLFRAPVDDPNGDVVQKLVGSLNTQTVHTMRWLLTCSAASNQQDCPVDLVHHAPLHTGERDPQDGLLILRDDVREEEMLAVPKLTPGGSWPSAAEIYRGLVGARRHPKAHGLGVFIETLYRLCAPLA